MRAGDDLQAASGGNRIHRDPGAHAGAVDVVVRLVLMPRRALPGPAFLDQNMIVIEPDLVGSHQRGRDRGHARVPGQPLDHRDLLPPAEVLSKRARVTWAAGYLGQRRGVSEDALDGRCRVHEFGGIENLPDADHAVPAECVGRSSVSSASMSDWCDMRPTVAAARSWMSIDIWSE